MQVVGQFHHNCPGVVVFAHHLTADTGLIHRGIPHVDHISVEIDGIAVIKHVRNAGTDAEPFESDVRASQQRLPNGNTLITEETGGRILEVTRDHEIVWEFVNPVRAEGRGEGGADMIPVISWAQRIDPAGLDPGFLGP